jgi:hypothetical protein
MTWKLYLYDADENEVGWATVDPHDYWVDPELPDADPVSANLRMLGLNDSVRSPQGWVSEDGASYPVMETVIEEDNTPHRDRLEQCAADLQHEGWVAAYELSDE